MDKYFKSIDRNKWVRNPQWLQFPPDDGLDNKVYALYAVFEGETNELLLAGERMVRIDWGDGTVVTGLFDTSFTDIPLHTYNYTTLSGPILEYEDGRNYKMVMIEWEFDNSGGRAYFDFGRMNSLRTHNLLDIDVRILGTNFTQIENSYSFRLGHICRPIYLERVKAKYPINSNGATRMLNRAVRLCQLDVPNNFFDYWRDGNGRNFDGVGLYSKVPCTFPPINNSNVTSTSTSIFRDAARFIFQDVNLPNATSPTTVGQQSHIIKCGDLNLPSATSLLSFFRGTVGGNTLILGIGTINAPLATDLRFMFQSSLVPEVVFTDCSNVTNTGGMFDETGNIRKLIMPGLTVGIDVSGNNLGTDAINDFFTSLGTASGSQTINVSGNPGAATCDTSIATGKGFIVIT
jgi:hypothetical protein